MRLLHKNIAQLLSPEPPGSGARSFVHVVVLHILDRLVKLTRDSFLLLACHKCFDIYADAVLVHQLRA
jgi:hypothetical protein